MVIQPGRRVLTLDPAVRISRRAVAVPAGGNWWEVAGKTTKVAYQPKGAASQAASYSNLANPGTNDAAPGTAPTWASGTGWTFNGSTQYLTTGLTPTDTGWTYLVRFSGVSGSGARGLIGSYNSGAGASLTQVNDSAMDAYNGLDYPSGLVNNTPTMTVGVYTMAGKALYRDGTAETNSVPAGSGTLLAMFVGAINITGGAGNFFNGNILAVAVYSDTLTAGEVATVSSAMAAL